MKWYSKEIWANKEGWKYIAINLVGNLFPVWFLVVIEFANNGISFLGFIKTISQPFTYLVLAATFASYTIYLWVKKLKSEKITDSSNKSFSIGMLLYVVVLFPIIGFYLSKKDCLEVLSENCAYIIPVIYYILLPVVVFIYIYYQLYDFYELNKMEKKLNFNATVTVNDEVDELNKNL